jgi:hypothetical protein
MQGPHQLVGLGRQDGTGFDLFAARISPFRQELTVGGVPLIITYELAGLPGERTVLDRFPPADHALPGFCVLCGLSSFREDL